MQAFDQMPITVKRSLELLGLVLIGFVVYVGQDILMPLLFSFFVALLLLPIVRWLRNKGIHEVIAIIISIVIALLIIALIMYFIGWQVSHLVRDYPMLMRNIQIHLDTLTTWIADHSPFSKSEQMNWLNLQLRGLVKNAGTYLSGVAVGASNLIVFVGLMPIYVFLMLFYKNLLLRFVFLWFHRENHESVEESMRETQVIIKSYLLGLMIQIAYITIGLGGILLLFGIKHALLIGIIFAILNLIPYIGAFIGNVIGVLLTLSSSNQLWEIFVVLGVIAFVQFLDNNILMPKIVGEKVRINALVTIIGLVIGGSLAGISGMFLSLPVLAIFKIIFDNTLEFRHWGVLLGSDRPGISPMSNPVVRRSKRDKLEEQAAAEKDDEDQGVQ